MTRTELIIQLLKVAIGLAFGAYFVWWSLQVLDRLTPEYDAPTAVVARASWTAARQSGVRGVDPRLRARRPHANAWLRADTRGRDGGVRQKLVAGVADAPRRVPVCSLH
jgi:hypothetical protein